LTANLVPSKLEVLQKRLLELGRLVVAFSGGADSAFLAKVATDTLGPENVLCATAVSPSLADDELSDVRALVSEWNLRHLEVLTEELDDPLYQRNDSMRCARCKTALMDALNPLALEEKSTVVLGVNLDDLDDHRPGQNAASDMGAVFPLVDAGFTKAALRLASKDLGLRTWDKPAAACLASRIPYGTPVSKPVLREVGSAESALRELGFRVLRVRHYGDLARIELGTDELRLALERRKEVVAAVRRAGYRYVTVDLEGFRSGNLNDHIS
jgi:pyridinium-3,5-biscarboxylic acid mononucleotide sulfurtransferase